MTYISSFLTDIEPDCANILSETATIMKLLEQGMQTADLHKRIDLFFYIEASAKMKLIIRTLRESSNPDLSKFNELNETYEQFKTRWRIDYYYIATPRCLHY